MTTQVFLDSKVRHYTTATIAGLIAGGVLGGVVLQFGGAFGVLCVGTGTPRFVLFVCFPPCLWQFFLCLQRQWLNDTPPPRLL